jgi:carbamoyltransferase
MKTLGIFYFPNYADPSAAIIDDGKVVAFVEEERLVRNKHATGYFPSRAVRWVLTAAGLGINDVDAITIGWDCGMHDDGRLAAHFESINALYPPTDFDLAYQRNRLSSYTRDRYGAMIRRHLRKMFGDGELPPLVYVPHHLAHAVMAHCHSGFGDSLVLIVDGSGEAATCSWWMIRSGRLELLHEVRTPHSLGWFYSAFTEFLGFDAYDGEYKVMGLAAYGEPDPAFSSKLEQLIWYDGRGGFESRPEILSMGPRTHSAYFPDALIEYLNVCPRADGAEIEPWHMRLAYEVQQRLESIVQDMVRYWRARTHLDDLCLSGGVALNVKMNGNLFAAGHVNDIFVHPLSSDTGMSVASGLTHAYLQGGLESRRLEAVYWGPDYGDDMIEKTLQACGISYSHEPAIERRVAELLADGQVVGWFQGRMEAGPRALGGRSILADPRQAQARDRVNEVIKFREFWRPFCPSMTEEAANRFLKKHTHAPFMILTFETPPHAKEEIAAVVHVDGTSRVQIVYEDINPRYFRLLQEFENIAGVPVLMNTSFNVKGEPIVCSPHDALRTFFATGMEALAMGPFLIKKPTAVRL